MTAPYRTEALAYISDSGELMNQLAALGRPVFLCGGNFPGSRFDILAAEPVTYVQIAPDKAYCSDPEIHIDRSDIFNTIKQLRDKYLPNSEQETGIDKDLPFQGGLLGYLGYPRLQGRSALHTQDGYIGVYRWAIVADHHLQRSTLVLHASVSDKRASELLKLLSPAIDEAGQFDKQTEHATQPQAHASGGHSLAKATDQGFRLRSPFSRHLSRPDYEQAFASIKAYIQAGDCYQVNLTQKLSADCEGSPLAAFHSLRATHQAPFSAYINWGDGALLSLSPERFIRLEQGQVLTQPIKGTRPRHTDPEQDQALAKALLASEKDQAENLMIVDLLRNDLGKVCITGSIKANQLFALNSFSNVHHLVSSISARLKPENDALDLLQACFPGGSITGAPKLRAMEIIEELEQDARRVYCGSVFYVSANGDMDSSITIRSLLWEADTVQCWAGGGIIDDSVCADEYAECFDKISSIISSLNG